MYDEQWIEESLKKPLYNTAFIHRSYLNESSDEPESNERLEFLGDSILSLIVSNYLFTQRKSDTEGGLTNLRSYIVKTQSLGKAAKNLHLGKFLKLSKGEELSGGRDNPQLMANTYEALIGAIYLEDGMEEAQKFVMETLIPLFENELKSGPPKDSKSMLQELAQNVTKSSPRYRIISTSGPDHAKRFIVGVFLRDKKIGEGFGNSKQEAEEKAATEALQGFENN